MTSVAFFSILQNYGLRCNEEFIALLGSSLTEPFNQIQGTIQSLCPEQNIPGNQILTMSVNDTSGNVPYAQFYITHISLAHISSIIKVPVPLQLSATTIL